MTGSLEDYDTARYNAVLSVLEMLTAEHQLASPGSDVLAMAGDDCEVDQAAGELAEAVQGLPPELQPTGWRESLVTTGDLGAARTRFVWAMLLHLAARCAEGHPRAAAEKKRAEEQLVLAARNLAADAELARSARVNERGRLL